VRTATTSDAAIKAVYEAPVHRILTEVELQPVDGFELKRKLDADAKTKGIPLIYFTARTAAADVDKGFGLGALDYVVKPSPVDIVVGKINRLLEQAQASSSTGGVAGSLREMSLPDLVQILAHGRKTGQLKLVMENKRGEIHFVNGDIYNAFFDNMRGDEAFFAMLKFRDGTFRLAPDFKAGDRVITMTAEMLLLEGLRRLDEENRGG
jgi:DNA-binding response OmpR family regulator